MIELSDPQWLAKPRRFDRGPVCIGRSRKQAHVPVTGEKASRVHVVVDFVGGRWWLVEVGKMALLRINGAAVPSGKAVELKDKDVVAIDGQEFGVRIRTGVTGRPNPEVEANPAVGVARALIAAAATGAPPKKAADPDETPVL